MTLKERDLVLCTVKKIEGTTVFLDIDSSEDNKKGTMVLSEVAAGRIRNLRAHVTPNKKIVCKILKISSDHVELSLRRVSNTEKLQVLEKIKRERNFKSMLKAITPKHLSIYDKIKEKHEISEFLDDARESPAILEPYFSSSEIEKLSLILKEKSTSKEVQKTFSLKTNSSTGLADIKSILTLDNKETKIHYLGSSKFSISSSAKNLKEADNVVSSLLEKIIEKAKSLNAQITTK